MKKRSFGAAAAVAVVGAALLAALGCGPTAPLHPITPQQQCTATHLRVVPGNGAGPLFRMTPIAATWSGRTDGVEFTVSVAGAAVDGDTFVEDGRAIFVPNEALPGASVVSWKVATCGPSASGLFVTGALMQPVNDDALDAIAGSPFALDLRAATWEAPTPNDAIAAVLLKWRLAPAMFIMLNQIANDGTGTFAVVPAVVDDNGMPQPDLTRRAQLVRASLAGNPYIALAPPSEISLAIAHGALTLRYVDLVVGLGEKGLEDGRLSAEVDVRGVAGFERPCDTIARFTGTGCFACDESDLIAGGSCFLLEMSDITAVPRDDAVLGPLGQRTPVETETVPGVDVDVPTDALQFPAIDPRITCPSGYCPPRPVATPPRPPITLPNPKPARK